MKKFTMLFDEEYDYCGAKNQSGIHSVDGITAENEEIVKQRFASGFLDNNSPKIEVFIMLNDCLFRTVVPLDRILARTVVKKARKVSKIRAFECVASAPFSRKQIEMLIEENDLQPIATRYEVLQENKSNNGKNIEYIASRFYHKRFDHTKSWIDGGEFNGRQVKFFDMDSQNGRHVVLCGITEKFGILA